MPWILPLSTQDITPYGNGLFHVNSILQPCTATTAPVVGVAVTAVRPVPGCGTGASREWDIEEASRFCLEVAKAFTSGSGRVFDAGEFFLMKRLYGSMEHLMDQARPQRLRPRQSHEVGALTIGQSPRLDVEPDFLAVAGPGVELLQRGALDGLSPEDVAGLEPRPGEYLLVTRLRGGTEVRLAEARIVERMRGCVRDLESEGVELIALSDGRIPGLESRVPLLKHDRLIAKFLTAVSPGAAICASSPSTSRYPP